MTPHEEALLDYLTRHFDRLMVVDRAAPQEPSLQILVRALAGVLTCDMSARGLTEAALARTVEPYCRLLRTWTREALAYRHTRPDAPSRLPHEDA